MANPIKNMTGKKYYHLTILEPNGRSKSGVVLWLAQCVCDNLVTIRGDNIRRESARHSCGCIKGNKYTDRIEALLRRSYTSIKQRQKKRNYGGVIISFEEYRLVVAASCLRCSVINSKIATSRDKTSDTILVRNTIDRIDNTKGYTSDNVQTLCHSCNDSKHGKTMKEWLG